jgi:hypothetical protein
VGIMAMSCITIIIIIEITYNINDWKKVSLKYIRNTITNEIVEIKKLN